MMRARLPALTQGLLFFSLHSRVIHRYDRFLTGLSSSMLFDFPFPMAL